MGQTRGGSQHRSGTLKVFINYRRADTEGYAGRVYEALRRPIGVANLFMDVDSMIWQRSRLGGAGAVAIRGPGGRLDGLVLEEQLWAVPLEHRSWTLLTSLMAPLDRLPRADLDDDLAGVLPRVHPMRPVITVWRDGRLLGVVPPKVVKERIENLVAAS